MLTAMHTLLAFYFEVNAVQVTSIIKVVNTRLGPAPQVTLNLIGYGQHPAVRA